jgi:hypothetical protein
MNKIVVDSFFIDARHGVYKIVSRLRRLLYVYDFIMDRIEQRYIMKFLFMDGKGYKAIHTELSRVLKEHAVTIDVCTYWCRRFKAGDFSMDDQARPGRPPTLLADAIMAMLADEPSFRRGFS